MPLLPLQGPPSHGTVQHSLALSQAITSALVPLSKDDPIHACGSSALHIISERPDDVLALAHQKLHTWKFSDVSLCWRRLYEEASLWKALTLLTDHAHRGRKRKRSSNSSTSTVLESDYVESPPSGEGDWIARIVYVLDMAVILSGAPARRSLIQDIFDSLQAFLHPDEHPDIPVSFSPASKARTQNDTFVRKQKLDFLQFQQHLDTKSTPIIISGVMDDWPAIADPGNRWSNPTYLLRSTLGGRRLVPVELGRSYTDDDWSQKIMTFSVYMQTYLLQPKQAKTGYLAQHDLFSQIPSLSADTNTPDYCYTSPPPPTSLSSTVEVETLDEPLRNAWLGPAGTISPLHTDPYHNILCQVVGHKYIRLYAPSETEKLYPRGIDEAGVNMENTSHVDISLARKLFEPSSSEEHDPEEQIQSDEFEARFPRFKDAEYVEGVLGPGECLYIPVGWWHYVESLSTSFSMSFWWN